ncbi:MAG TPA: hypothetical protein PKM25_05400, partial [Candidatus Ozemobacteraceae bacterium]|nr:hypothetical protein [Candidatus Ozemobacteraceae bacterium]
EQVRAPLFEEKVVNFILEIAKVDDKEVSVDELMKAAEEHAGCEDPSCECHKEEKPKAKKAKKSEDKEEKPAKEKAPAKARQHLKQALTIGLRTAFAEMAERILKTGPED